MLSQVAGAMPKQLSSFAPDGFKVLSGVTSRGDLLLRRADTMPQVVWPDGHWCIEVNLYLLELLNKGLQHEPRGGSLGTYASALSDLIRHSHKHLNKSFIAFTDGDFTACVTKLYTKKRLRRGRVTSANNRTTVHAIANVWLDFLDFVGHLYGHPSFVARTGTIRAYKPLDAGQSKGRRDAAGWCHHALSGARDPYNHRAALSDEHLKQLRDAAARIGRSRFSRRRMLVMLELFDTLGLRRIELHWLTVRNVVSCANEWHSTLELQNRLQQELPSHATFVFRKAKSKSADDTREVPISPVTLQYLEEYLTVLRRMVERLGLSYGPDTPLFPNLGRQPSKRGKPVQPGYFTLDFHRLAVAAGISVPCAPHNARHRYIVKELVRLILSHHIENVDDFRRALLDSKVFVGKLRQLTGHASEQGLRPYISQAFDEVANMKSVLRRVDAHRGADALQAARERFWLALKTGENPREAGIALAKSVEAYESGVAAPNAGTSR